MNFPSEAEEGRSDRLQLRYVTPCVGPSSGLEARIRGRIVIELERLLEPELVRSLSESARVNAMSCNVGNCRMPPAPRLSGIFHAIGRHLRLPCSCVRCRPFDRSVPGKAYIYAVRLTRSAHCKAAKHHGPRSILSSATSWPSERGPATPSSPKRCRRWPVRPSTYT